MNGRERHDDQGGGCEKRAAITCDRRQKRSHRLAVVKYGLYLHIEIIAFKLLNTSKLRKSLLVCKHQITSKLNMVFSVSLLSVF